MLSFFFFWTPGPPDNNLLSPTGEFADWRRCKCRGLGAQQEGSAGGGGSFRPWMWHSPGETVELLVFKKFAINLPRQTLTLSLGKQTLAAAAEIPDNHRSFG